MEMTIPKPNICGLLCYHLNRNSLSFVVDGTLLISYYYLYFREEEIGAQQGSLPAEG